MSTEMITELSQDESLEMDIEFVRRLVMSGQTAEVRRAACALMTLLVAQRSAQGVREMERERGLTR